MIPILLSFSDHTPAAHAKRDKKSYSVEKWEHIFELNVWELQLITRRDDWELYEHTYQACQLPLPFSELSSDVLCARRRWSSM